MNNMQGHFPLAVALSRAATDERAATELRQILVYAADTADVATVIELGKTLDRIWDDIAKCPTQPQTITPQDPRTKPRRRKAKVR